MLILDSTFENSRKSHARAKGVSKAVKRYLHLERLPEPQPTDACLADDAAMPADGSEDGLYDRVLVDAECTHDGSLKHLTKFHSLGWETFCERVLHPDRFPHLQALQLQLLRYGDPFHTLILKLCYTVVYDPHVFAHPGIPPHRSVILTSL